MELEKAQSVMQLIVELNALYAAFSEFRRPALDDADREWTRRREQLHRQNWEEVQGDESDVLLIENREKHIKIVTAFNRSDRPLGYICVLTMLAYIVLLVTSTTSPGLSFPEPWASTVCWVGFAPIFAAFMLNVSLLNQLKALQIERKASRKPWRLSGFARPARPTVNPPATSAAHQSQASSASPPSEPPKT